MANFETKRWIKDISENKGKSHSWAKKKKMARNKRLLENNNERLEKKRHLLEDKMTGGKKYLNT